MLRRSFRIVAIQQTPSMLLDQCRDSVNLH
jgi:hypothetical protein